MISLATTPLNSTIGQVHVRRERRATVLADLAWRRAPGADTLARRDYRVINAQTESALQQPFGTAAFLSGRWATDARMSSVERV